MFTDGINETEKIYKECHCSLSYVCMFYIKNVIEFTLFYKKSTTIDTFIEIIEVGINIFFLDIKLINIKMKTFYTNYKYNFK